MAGEEKNEDKAKKRTVMRENVVLKALLTSVMVAWLQFFPATGYTPGQPTLTGHLLYMISHANGWHLAGNLLVLWMMRGRLHILPSAVIAFLCSWLPSWSFWHIGMTVGFSGVLFAVIGIKWGIYCRTWAMAGSQFARDSLAEFLAKIVPFSLIGIVIPNMNWCLHLYCLLAGFAYGRLLK